ncbi:NAD(P)H-binding protein [Flammeovirga sp. SJP92]|uniref:NAD(P)H-binding protein n=1 Tax=Flammeovirga sp. SJP92 TaxID=1775430 RepID=UPI000786E302|nr:NAD(P)H-binding protein [Flammeovirga sp. SJP92]KXX66827.1 hypothetical protein AVL50_30305 [Flammeovirga sp. SJP92]
MQNKLSVVFFGATGAVGSVAFHHLLTKNNLSKLLTLGRRSVESSQPPSFLDQQVIDIHTPSSYSNLITDFDTAICTLGVGEPSKISKQDFIKIDKTAVLNFAKVCKEKGVKQFHLLASVGTNSSSYNYYLRAKGELIDELVKLNFDRLCIYQPSMILTPKNRYGITQAITLKVWPKLDPVFQNGLRKYRGITVEKLGKSIANNISEEGTGIEYLLYDDFLRLQD